MPDRLSLTDVSFLHREDVNGPIHVGSLGLLRPGPGGLTYSDLCDIVERRLDLVPRYRQKIRAVPAGLARPVWVDDPEFDVRFHVRRSILPRPGTTQQLRELVARVMARRVDRKHPLWEMYLVEGLEDGRVGLLSKTHQAMIDTGTVDLTQVILAHRPADVVADGASGQWQPAPAPSDLGLVVRAVGDLIRQPTRIMDTLRLRLLHSDRGTLTTLASGIISAARTAARPAPPSPLNTEIGSQRSFAMLRTELEDYRRIRRAYGTTITGVVLATITGALRSWLLMRGEPLNGQQILRALVPVSAGGVRDTRVDSLLVDLPVGERDPRVRLHQISYALDSQRQTGQFVSASVLIGLSGFAPPTLHTLGAKAAAGLSRRLYNLMITNVPGPQEPLYLDGARLEEVYPVQPLSQGQALAIGVTSYHGGVYYGLNADRRTISDPDPIADLIAESLTELVETVP